jgi:hypothetical protein
MTSHTKFVFCGVLGCLLLCTAAYSEELTEEYIASTTAEDGGNIVLIKKIKSLPEAERTRAIQLTLTLIERNIGKPHPGRDLPKFVGLLPILPMLGMPNEVAARLAPMIDCENPRIRPDVFRALAELDNDAGLDAVLSRMDYLVSRLPDANASFSEEERRQRHADALAFIYGMKGLLQAKADEKRKLGLSLLDQVRMKYADTEKGREMFAGFVWEFQRLGVSLDSHDSLGVNVLRTRPAPETLSEKPTGGANSDKKSDPTLASIAESPSSVRFPFLLVAILAVGTLAFGVIITLILKRRF